MSLLYLPGRFTPKAVVEKVCLDDAECRAYCDGINAHVEGCHTGDYCLCGANS